MAFLEKDSVSIPPRRIYRGNDAEYDGQPLPKEEDYFDSLGSYEERLKYATWRGFQASALLATVDIAYYTRLTERRAQLMRAAFFIVPGVAMAAGYVSALEIGKKVLENKKAAYALAGTVPAGIWASWRKNPKMFPKMAFPIAAAGVLYRHLVETNHYTSWYNKNPNNPGDFLNKEISYLSWPGQREVLNTKFPWSPRDPGPTYAKWENEGK